MNEPLPPHALAKLLGDGEPLLVALHAPQTLGKYTIVREVGRGGMGVVYEAIDRDLERRVALKMIAAPVLGSETQRARFRREAQAVARLTHPSIAAVYDVIDGAIVMQYVDGVSLATLPKTDVRRLVSLVRDAALAVHFAHQHEIIHRDLKPHNLMVEGERVMVMDFGLAKVTTVDSSLSLSGHLLGTPAYMAPEQARGRVHEVDARSDVYGLGATLYEVLTGRPPFAGDDLVRLLRRIMEDDPIPPRSLRRDLPRDLETIVVKCLAKEPSLRYASAAALADDLTRWLEGKPVHARRPSLGYRASKLIARHRALVTVAAVGVLALAVAWSENLKRDAAQTALQLSELIATTLADAQTHLRLGDTELAHQCIDDGIRACHDYLGRHDAGYVHFFLGRLLRASNRRDEARVELDRALELDPNLHAARLERGLLLATEVADTAARTSAATPSELIDRCKRDLHVIEAHPQSLRMIDAALGRGEIARLDGNLDGARRAFEEARRLDPTNVYATIALSQLALREGNDDAAWNLAMSAIDLYRGFGPAYLARTASREASSLDHVASGHELAAASRQIEAGDHSAQAWLTRASARLQLDDVEGALADFDAALRAQPGDAHAYGNRAIVHARKAARLAACGEVDPALTAWQAAIDDDTCALTLEPQLGGAYNNRGVGHLERERLLTELGRMAEAGEARTAAGLDFDRAIECSPRFALAFANRALQRRRVAEELSRAGRAEDALATLAAARADLERVLELKPGDPTALLERALDAELTADCQVVLQDFAAARDSRTQAAAQYDEAVKAAPSDARPLGLRGLHHLRNANGALGIDDLEAALRLQPDGSLHRRFERALALAKHE